MQYIKMDYYFDRMVKKEKRNDLKGFQIGNSKGFEKRYAMHKILLVVYFDASCIDV